MAEQRKPSKPPGIRFIERRTKWELSFKTQRAIVLFLTFIAYASYHAARKTSSVVKTALLPDSPSLGREADPGWAPFNLPGGPALLGDLDVAFLSVYALGIYLSGHLADHLNQRKFLAWGMVLTGAFTLLLGAGYWLEIHRFSYYFVVMMLAGLCQSTGWPTVVAVVERWCGKSSSRGVVMGVWNAHTSLGNVAGSLMAAAPLSYGWGWSFVPPAVGIVVVGGTVVLFLPLELGEVGEWEKERLVEREEEEEECGGVGFLEAWGIPGVAQFAFCLFFSKLVAYAFLFWLPAYLTQTEIGGRHLTDTEAGKLSTVFDVGGVAGAILAGHISDRTGAPAITAAGFTFFTIPSLFFFHAYGGLSLLATTLLMFAAGVFVNGPYALITTAVAAELGGAAERAGRARAVGTVAAIIDGTGSAGAAVGSLVVGRLSGRGWSRVFLVLMAAAFFAGVLLTRLVLAEASGKIKTSEIRPDDCTATMPGV